MSSFWFGTRKAAPEGVPVPPPMYKYVDAAQPARTEEPRAALRASKLLTVSKFTREDRIAGWMQSKDAELGGLERWRRQVAVELGRLQQEDAASRQGQTENAASAPPNPNLLPPPRSTTASSHSTTDGTVSPAVITTARAVSIVQTHPFAVNRGVDRSTVVLGCSPIELPPVPKTPAGFIPPVPRTPAAPLIPTPNLCIVYLAEDVPNEAIYRFPAPPSLDKPLPPIQTNVVHAHSASVASATSTAEPGPWHGTPPPRMSSLPFGNLVQAPLDTPAHCAILPPKAAALLGLIPSASAPLGLRGPLPPAPQSRATTSSIVSSSHLATNLPQPSSGPQLLRYESRGDSSAGYTGARKSSTDSNSIVGSAYTGRSFWSFGDHCTRTDSLSYQPHRPSYGYNSSFAPTSTSITSPSSAPGRRLFGVGGSFSAALTQAQAKGIGGRTKSPPPQLRIIRLRKEGTSSLPDLSASLEGISNEEPAQQFREQYGPEDNDEDKESLVDVYDYRQVNGGAGRLTSLVTATSSSHRPTSGGRGVRKEGGVVGSLVRTLSNGKSTFFSRKLSRRASRKESRETASNVVTSLELAASEMTENHLPDSEDENTCDSENAFSSFSSDFGSESDSEFENDDVSDVCVAQAYTVKVRRASDCNVRLASASSADLFEEDQDDLSSASIHSVVRVQRQLVVKSYHGTGLVISEPSPADGLPTVLSQAKVFFRDESDHRAWGCKTLSNESSSGDFEPVPEPFSTNAAASTADNSNSPITTFSLPPLSTSLFAVFGGGNDFCFDPKVVSSPPPFYSPTYLSTDPLIDAQDDFPAFHLSFAALAVAKSTSSRVAPHFLRTEHSPRLASAKTPHTLEGGAGRPPVLSWPSRARNTNAALDFDSAPSRLVHGARSLRSGSASSFGPPSWPARLAAAHHPPPSPTQGRPLGVLRSLSSPTGLPYLRTVLPSYSASVSSLSSHCYRPFLHSCSFSGASPFLCMHPTT
ncbi:hypothetical protein JCM11641_005871 [Rhodosporidiobolus odoratus]